MTKVIDTRGAIPTPTDTQRAKTLDLIRAKQDLGSCKALRQAGVPGKRSVLQALLDQDEELAEDIREARGYGSDRIRREIKDRAFAGPDDPASGRILLALAKAHLPEYRDQSNVNVEHTGDVRLVIESAFPAADDDVIDGDATEDDDGDDGTAGRPALPRKS